jgi:hypothetical protein
MALSKFDKMRTTDRLRFRYGPTIRSQSDFTLNKGDIVQVLDAWVVADGYKWSPAYTRDTYGWVARDYVAPYTAPVSLGQIGIHVAGSGHYGDLIPMADRLHQIGRPIPLVVSVDHIGLGEALAKVSPTTTSVYRFVATANDPTPFDLHMDGWAWFRRMWESWGNHRLAKDFTFHQMDNEWTFHGNQQDLDYAKKVRDFYMQLMAAADAYGVKVCIGNYMPGVPDPDIYGTVLAPMYERAAASGHAASFHWYSDAKDDDDMIAGKEWMVERTLRYLQKFHGIHVLITEHGLYNSPRHRGVASMRARWRESVEILAPWPHVKTAWWTISGQNDIQWRADDWTPYLSVYEEDRREGRI